MDSPIIEEYRQKIAIFKEKPPKTADEWKAYNRLAPLIPLFEKLDKLESRLRQAQELLESEVEPDMAQLAQEELDSLKTDLEDVKTELTQTLEELEETHDGSNEKNAILEIRAGAGGEEASLFAGDLFRMYSQFAQKKGFELEILNKNLSDTGGFKEIIAKISGDGAYGFFKFESGVHRVQRVPTTESSGRIHTSTASVAVMPEAQEVDVEIKPEDLKIDTFRASGAGGQHVNRTDSAVRITHTPTGTVVSCQESRSQLKNREIAMSLLRSRLYEKQLEEEQSKRASMRRQQIGSAMRAEKIRTYNFPQNRITDHRIKKSWHTIDEVLDGDLDDIIESLRNPTSDKENNSDNDSKKNS